MNITITCMNCKKQQNIIIADPAAYEQWKKQRAKGHGPMIQDAFPELTPDEREMLMSQTCGTCWDELFKEADEDVEITLDGPKAHPEANGEGVV